MKIILCGFGQMGQMLSRLAPDAGLEVAAVVDPFHGDATHGTVSELPRGAARVLIDFSTPAAAPENIRQAASMGLDVVAGTTGWHDHLAAVEQAVREARTGLIHASNFSVGVFLFRRIVQAAAGLVNGLDEFDVAIHERHHIRKADSPSGTALTLAEDVLARIDRKKSILRETSHGKIDPAALHVTSSRVGSVPGDHSMTIDGAADSITLTHSARSREGFALGALRAAKWIAGRPGVFTIDDMLEIG